MGDSMSTIINATTTNGVVIQPDNSGSLVLQTNSGTTALTIDTSQKVLMGTTTSPSGGSIQLALSNTFGAGIQLNNSTGVNGGAITSTGGNGLVFFGYTGAMGSETYAERMRIDSSGNLLFNSGYGSVATAYGCRAWVNFNGTGTVAIRASGNVSSITDLASGQYEVNFTNALSDANYSVHVQAGEGGFTTNWSTVAPVNGDITTSKVEIGTTNGSTQTDALYVSVSIFR